MSNNTTHNAIATAVPVTKTYTNRHGRSFVSQPHDVFERCQGIYQVSSLRYLRDQRPQARRVIDVGANVGITAIEYATWAHNVEAFECNDFTRQLLQQNIITAQQQPAGVPWYQQSSTQLTGHIQVHACALMDRVSTGFVTHREAGLADFVRYDTGDQACTTATIDSFGFTDVDIIKIDTEGTEWLVVQGADQTIRQQRPVLCVEFWNWEKRKSIGLHNQAMLDYFQSINYRHVNNRGQDLPWDAHGKWTKQIAKAHGQNTSAMDRFFVPN